MKRHNYNKNTNFVLYIIFSIVVYSTILFSTNHTNFKQQKWKKIYTTKDISKNTLSHKIYGLNNKQLDMFILGKSFFTIPWVQAPSSTTARDGLGPLFNSNTCISCHPNNSKGTLFKNNYKISNNYVSKLSIPSNNSIYHKNIIQSLGIIPDPIYGEQINTKSIYGLKPEAKNIIKYENITLTYSDGTNITLRKPLKGIKNQLTNLNYGNISKNIIIANRLAPALIGLGLLDQLKDEDILKNEDINDSNNDGISGKANIIYDKIQKRFRVGKYTAKASSYSIFHQTAIAAFNDMGLTNIFFQKENCNENIKCLKIINNIKSNQKNDFDLTTFRLKAISFYLKGLKIPVSKITEKKGEKLFNKIGCIKCHISSFKLSNGYIIKPFSDMLLHDMGDELSDGRVEFKANENEFRTTPLWGIGKHKFILNRSIEFLHDGRARSIEEAILWHGGEAKKSRDHFMKLSKYNRDDLIKYINQL